MVKIIERLFSWGSAFLILLILPLIWTLSGFAYCRMASCGLGALGLFILPPIFYVIEIIIFLGIKFILSKFFKKLKDYQLALIFSGILLIAMFFLGPQLKAGLAYLTNDIVFCKMMSSKDKKDCISLIAAETLNESICDDPDANKEWCKKEIGNRYYGLATKNADISLCEKAKDYKGDCYYDFAISTDNPKLCEKVINSAYFMRDKDNCYKELAKRRKDVDLCNKIENISEKDSSLESMSYLPDLIIENIKIEPSSPKIGDTLKFFVTVKNKGKNETGKFQVSVHKDSWGNRISIDKLAPNEGIEVAIVLDIKSSNQTGFQKFTIEVDDLNEIRELKEANNEIQKEIYIIPY